MTDRINHVEKLERIMEQLADSVLELSDEALLAEITESGADPQQEAERTRLVLRQAAGPEEGEDQRFPCYCVYGQKSRCRIHNYCIQEIGGGPKSSPLV